MPCPVLSVVYMSVLVVLLRFNMKQTQRPPPKSVDEQSFSACLSFLSPPLPSSQASKHGAPSHSFIPTHNTFTNPFNTVRFTVITIACCFACIDTLQLAQHLHLRNRQNTQLCVYRATSHAQIDCPPHPVGSFAVAPHGLADVLMRARKHHCSNHTNSNPVRLQE
jgi:hypothetical protein